MWVTLFLYAVLAVCASVVFAACFATSSGASSPVHVQEGLRVRSGTAGEDAAAQQEGLKLKNLGKKLGSATKNVTKSVSSAVTDNKNKKQEEDVNANANDDGEDAQGTVIRIPPQPDMQEVVRQISAQLHNLSKPQIMEIVKTAREVISEKNDEEQKLEDELNKL